MKFSRRSFIKKASLGSMMLSPSLLQAAVKPSKKSVKPIVISTWKHGQPANQAAWEILSKGGNALDAVEAGVRVPEGDPNVHTVGYGSYPDANGKVTLDACIMDHKQNCGSVAFIQDIKHPISVARKVMEDTPHVMLVGEGAYQFAISKGFKKESLLIPEMEKEYEKWKQEHKYEPVINIENHDTIGLLAIDEAGNLSGACTTSGASYKMHGRVGDSPIIGAGLYVDNEVGAATATGMGELVIKTVGSHLVVEYMYQGYSPMEACKKAVERIAHKLDDYKSFQVGFLALNKQGEYGAYCIQKGFNYAVKTKKDDIIIDSDHMI